MKKAILFILFICALSSFGQKIGRFPFYTPPDTTSGEEGTACNLMFYSEQFDNATYTTYGTVTVTADQGTDMDSQVTMEQITMSASETWRYDDITTNISTETNYTISLEAYGDGCADLEIQAEIVGGSSITLTPADGYTVDYGNSLTGTAQRFTYTFTTPASLGSGLRISVVYFPSDACNGETAYVGRFWLTEGDASDQGTTWIYVTTTDTQITGE